MTAISKSFDADQDAALADDVGEMAGVAGEEQEGQHEDGAGKSGTCAGDCALPTWRATMI